MSFPITVPADYVGYLAISKNPFKEDKFEAYIAKAEPDIIKYLLNEQAFIEIRDASVLPERYDDLINGTGWTDTQGDSRNLTGLKTILLHFIYYRFVADNWQHTITGTTQNKNENSEKFPDGANKQAVYNRYNYGIDLYYDELIPFISEFMKITENITGFVDNGGGSYTIQTASTKYLADGDIINYDNVEYVVSNVVTDTSFDINTGVAGQTISGTYYYQPYK